MSRPKHGWTERGALLLLCALTRCTNSAAPDVASTASDDPGGGGAPGISAVDAETESPADASASQSNPSDEATGAPSETHSQQTDGPESEATSQGNDSGSAVESSELSESSDVAADDVVPDASADANAGTETTFEIVTNLGGASGALELFTGITSLCWLGAGRDQISCSGPTPEWSPGMYAVPISEETTVSFSLDVAVRQVALGRYHGCALLDSMEPEAQVVCWGQNEVGQLGVGDTVARPPNSPEALLPVDLGSGVVVLSLAAGENSTCALLDGGSIKCWGSLTFPGSIVTDPVGDEPDEMGDALPVVDLGERAAVQLAPALGGMCFVFDDGSVACSGQNTHGQLGQGDTLSRIGDPAQFPSAIDLGSGFAVHGVVGGNESYCARVGVGRADDGAKCWGNNASGQLALGDTADRGDMPGEMGAALPLAKLGVGSVSSLVVGDSHACALFGDARLKCWGRMILGDGSTEVPQFGATPDTIGSAIPAYDFGGKVPVQLVSGLWFACARFEDADFACWGRWMPFVNIR